MSRKTFRRLLATAAFVGVAIVGIGGPVALAAPSDQPSTSSSTSSAAPSSTTPSTTTSSPPASSTTTTLAPSKDQTTTSNSPSTTGTGTPVSTTSQPPTTTSGHPDDHPKPPPHGGDGHESQPPSGHDGEYHPGGDHPPVPASIQVDVSIRIGDQAPLKERVTVYQVKEIRSVNVIVKVDGRDHEYAQVTVIIEYGGAKHWCDGYYDEQKVFHVLTVYPSSVQTPAAAVSTPDSQKTLPSEAIVTGNNPEAASWWTDNRAWVVPVVAVVVLGGVGAWLVFRRSSGGTIGR